MPRKQTATRDSGSLDALVIQRLLRKWKRKSKEFGKQVRPEWEHGDRYASRRYEGESIALRWCAEDLEAALYNERDQARRDCDSQLKPQRKPALPASNG